jgi:F-type H+-transporting ATPase subunit epsilon
MHITIAKVDEVYFDGEADSLSAAGVSGQMTILSEHMPLITTLKPCTLVVRAAGETKKFEIEGGILEVRRDAATVIL